LKRITIFLFTLPFFFFFFLSVALLVLMQCFFRFQVEVLQSVVEAQLDATVSPQHVAPESVRQMTLKFWNQLSKLLAQELTNAADSKLIPTSIFSPLKEKH